MDGIEAKKPATTEEVRNWARKQGLEVGRRGHISDHVIAQFNRFHHKRVYVSPNPFKTSKEVAS